MLVLGLALTDAWRRVRAGLFSPGGNAAIHAARVAFLDQVLVIVVVAAVVLLVMAMVNTVVLAVFTARDSAGAYAVVRAVGATPRQVTVTFVVGQSAGGLVACVVGVPLGLTLFDVFVHGLGPDSLSWSTYPAVVGIVMACYALSVTASARSLATRPITPLLAHE
jgi:ABC-type antimicrobial peptide transport system permease subunit